MRWIAVALACAFSVAACGKAPDVEAGGGEEAAPVEEAPAPARGSKKEPPAAPVDLNTATAEELQTLPGVGPSLAEKIIAARPFSSVDDLDNVPGVGEKKMEQLRPYVTVGGAPAASAGEAAAGEAAGGEAAAGEAASGGAAAPARRPAAASSKVNINTATADELDALPGIGPSTAAKIVAHREENGPFTSIEDLMKVPGIGQAKFDQLKDHITI